MPKTYKMSEATRLAILNILQNFITELSDIPAFTPERKKLETIKEIIRNLETLKE